jgi:hypothetical protein
MNQMLIYLWILCISTSIISEKFLYILFLNIYFYFTSFSKGTYYNYYYFKSTMLLICWQLKSISRYFFLMYALFVSLKSTELFNVRELYLSLDSDPFILTNLEAVEFISNLVRCNHTKPITKLFSLRYFLVRYFKYLLENSFSETTVILFLKHSM